MVAHQHIDQVEEQGSGVVRVGFQDVMDALVEEVGAILGGDALQDVQWEHVVARHLVDDELMLLLGDLSIGVSHDQTSGGHEDDHLVLNRVGVESCDGVGKHLHALAEFLLGLGIGEEVECFDADGAHRMGIAVVEAEAAA